MGAWDYMLAALKQDIPKGYYDHYVSTLEPLRFENGKLLIGVESEDQKNWVGNRLVSSMNSLLSGSMNSEIALEFSA
jgi:chromosomal replication initiation ATPase DnaA